MADHSFRVGNIAFSYELTQIDPTTWTASLLKVQACSSSEAEESIKGTGHTAGEAADNLKETVRKGFTIQGEPLSLTQLIGAAYKWVWSAANKKQKCIRSVTVVAAGLAISPLFFDYFSGTSPISKNISGFVTAVNSGAIEPKGFFDEEFFAKALRTAKKRFWATGVSFRNLTTGNKDHLINFLQTNAEFKLVLLDPDSQLAQDSFIRRFSRTARRGDINNTLSTFLNPNDGVLTHGGNRNRHQLWISDYAPIIPMVLVDEIIYVSFLRHVSPSRTESAYKAPYIRFDVDSEIGKLLIAHFDSMLDSDGALRKYPAN